METSISIAFQEGCSDVTRRHGNPPPPPHNRQSTGTYYTTGSREISHCSMFIIFYKAVSNGNNVMLLNSRQLLTLNVVVLTDSISGN